MQGILVEGISPTDALDYSLMATSMAKQMGNDSKPPIALTLSQFLQIVDLLNTQWASSHTLDS